MASYLLDTNILLRVATPGSAEHTQAAQVIAHLLAAQEQVFITAQNLVEFWAVATRPSSANGLGWSVQQAANEVQQLQRRFSLLQETASIFPYWFHLVSTLGISGKHTHDARLIAVMLAHGVTHFLTFDTDDFKMFSGITLVHPDNVP